MTKIQCPTCKARSLHLSRLLIGNAGDTCDQCKATAVIDIQWKRVLIWLVPIMIVALLLRPWLGDFTAAIAAVVSIALGFRVVPKPDPSP